MRIEEILKKGYEGRVKIKGWLHNKRSSGSILFWILRDGSEFIQVVLKKQDFKNLKELEKIDRESVVEVEGDCRKQPKSPYGFEIEAKKFKLISKSKEKYPIAKKYHGPNFLLNYRHLYIRERKMFLILKVRAKILEIIREWFLKNGYKEFHSPILTKAACEGGATLFEVKYFDEKAFLTQSWQLYAEAGIASLGKIFTIAPSFRAEKSRTRRHLAEYWHIEVEEPWISLEDLMEIEEDLICFICQNISDLMHKELEELGRDVDKLKKIKPRFERITYKEAVERVNKKGIEMKFGEDFGADEERVLTKDLEKPIFVYLYPIEIKAFYVKEDPKNPGFGLTKDLLAPEGYGEITTGGIREEDVEKMKQRLKKEGLDPKNFEWYFDLRKYGNVQHGGFGLGLERLVMWICKLEHIRDAIPFPRTINRVYP